MKKIVYSILATAAGLVLLFSYRTSLDPDMSASSLVTGQAAATAAPSTAATAAAAPSTAASSTPSTASSSGLKDGTFTGQAADTPYGSVQVRIAISGGKITSVSVPQYPSESGRDQQINSYAVPQLVQETVSAQSTQIDMVSGATFTSQGYLQSLQSAIDQATA